jgi:peptidoglycan/xylan/chitin deacetylase (PgdA/CDA1 family)
MPIAHASDDPAAGPHDGVAPPGHVMHGPRDVAAVAFTFDDGPGAVTARTLDALAAHGGRATFDVLGARVAAGASLLRRMVDEGHEIGVHGWTHRVMTGRPLRATGELLRARAAIARAAAVRPRVFRAPYGAVDRRLVGAARRLGLVTVGWDVDPRDYEEPGAEAIRERVLSAIRPGSIVLLHDDRPALAPTAEALSDILPAVAARGLAPVTVSDLLDPSDPLANMCSPWPTLRTSERRRGSSGSRSA